MSRTGMKYRKFNMLYFKDNECYRAENLGQAVLLGYLSRSNNKKLAVQTNFDFEIL